MRGKRFVRLCIIGNRRITPADAGKTNQYAVSNKGRIGSPPRMRGKRIRCCDTPPFCRITPADAGKTFIVAGFVCMHEDHPRGCGENLPLRVYP